MSDRIPLADLTVDQYDAFCDEADRMALELAALRQVARGYCPACGRGDAAPTADDWEQQRKRADSAEEAARRALAQRQEMAAERYAWQERGDRAERERDTARQHAAAIAAQRDRLRQRMNTLADRWETALPGQPHHDFAKALREEISVAPFHDTTPVVQQYRADDGSQKWAVRCWGTDTCDGFLSLDHDTEQWAKVASDRHLAEAHTALDTPEPTP